jgi:hypothetical protein
VPARRWYNFIQASSIVDLAYPTTSISDSYNSSSVTA